MSPPPQRTQQPNTTHFFFFHFLCTLSHHNNDVPAQFLNPSPNPSSQLFFSGDTKSHTLSCFNLLISIHSIFSNVALLQKLPTSRSPRRDAVSFTVKAAQEPSASLASQGSFFFPLGLLRLNSQLPLYCDDKSIISYLYCS